MPKVPTEIFEIVFYLYPSREAAEAGEKAGGSGFFVTIESEDLGTPQDYAISNRHVVRDGDSVIRVNRRDGGVEIFEFDPAEWVVHPDGDDLAAVSLNLRPSLAARSMGTTAFATKEEFESGDLGVGDETFMVGRFVLADGGLRNVPAINFGNLSIPLGPLPTSRRTLQESFGVEMRSMGGYSGSPVFIVKSLYNPNTRKMVIGGFTPQLLGVQWGQIAEWVEVEEFVVENTGGPLGPHKVPFSRHYTGMNGVVPIWKVFGLLAAPALRKQRDAVDAAIVRRRGDAGFEDQQPKPADS